MKGRKDERYGVDGNSIKTRVIKDEWKEERKGVNVESK
jgi:hypothetical protein